MSEDTDIETLTPEIIEVEPKSRKRFGVPTLLGTAFLASTFGTAAMYFATNLLKKPTPNLSPLTASVETLSAETKTLKAQVARLQRDIKAIPKPATINISNIESRLDNLEKVDPQTIDSELIARIEALKTEGSDALDLSDVLARIDALESRPVTIIKRPATTATARSEARADIPFPSAKIMIALDKTEASKSWFKKTLNRHISVQSEDNPRYLVEVIIKNIESKNTEAAIAAFDKLPAEAKTVGQDWRDSVESN